MDRPSEQPKRRINVEKKGNIYVYSCTPELEDKDVHAPISDQIRNILKPDGGFVYKIALKTTGGSSHFLELHIPEKTDRNRANEVFQILRNAGVMDYFPKDEKYLQPYVRPPEDRLTRIARETGGKIGFTIETGPDGRVIKAETNVRDLNGNIIASEPLSY